MSDIAVTIIYATGGGWKVVIQNTKGRWVQVGVTQDREDEARWLAQQTIEVLGLFPPKPKVDAVTAALAKLVMAGKGMHDNPYSEVAADAWRDAVIGAIDALNAELRAGRGGVG